MFDCNFPLVTGPGLAKPRNVSASSEARGANMVLANRKFQLLAYGGAVHLAVSLYKSSKEPKLQHEMIHNSAPEPVSAARVP
jgi:hypothetical protein